MIEALDFVDELLDIAKDPERFSKPEMGEMILVAATEIIKLRSLNESDNMELRKTSSRLEGQVGED